MFGLTDRNGEVIDQRQLGETLILTVSANGITRRAARRTARLEATEVIPVGNQQVVNSTLDKNFRFQSRYLFNIAENPLDEEDAESLEGAGY